MERKLPRSFYKRDVLEVAPELIGKVIERTWPSGEARKYIITETEAYRGAEDEACHATKGITPRTRVMFREGGILYMYLIYGMHWMLNVVTSTEGDPQAVLIRGLKEVYGPGRLTKKLDLDGSFNEEDLFLSERISLYDVGILPEFTTHPRIGIDYAGEKWRMMPWRYLAIEKSLKI